MPLGKALGEIYQVVGNKDGERGGSCESELGE